MNNDEEFISCRRAMSLPLVDYTQNSRMFIIRHVHVDLTSFLHFLTPLTHSHVSLKLICWLLHTTLSSNLPISHSSSSLFYLSCLHSHCISSCTVFYHFFILFIARSVETIQLHKPITLSHRKSHKLDHQQCQIILISNRRRVLSSLFLHLSRRIIDHQCKELMEVNGRMGWVKI